MNRNAHRGRMKQSLVLTVVTLLLSTYSSPAATPSLSGAINVSDG